MLCVEKKDSTTFDCVAVENTEESKTTYLALASKANGGSEYEIECTASYVKNALVFMSLIV